MGLFVYLKQTLNALKKSRHHLYAARRLKTKRHFTNWPNSRAVNCLFAPATPAVARWHYSAACRQRLIAGILATAMRPDLKFFGCSGINQGAISVRCTCKLVEFRLSRNLLAVRHIKFGRSTNNKTDHGSGALTDRLASRYSATGQTNRLKCNLDGHALIGRSKTALNSAVVRSCHSQPAPFRCRFQNARSVRPITDNPSSRAVLSIEYNF